METIWLQRPSGDIPWGFRLQGGQEFNQPLSVLRCPDPLRGCSVKMETIWLQRPSGDIPWGFRLQGGQEFNQPLSVLRVTPGSVAANSNGLTAGDIVLKIGNVNATNISHNEAQEVITGASNILQLTIKKGAAQSAPVSPQSTGYPVKTQQSSPYDQQQQLQQAYQQKQKQQQQQQQQQQHQQSHQPHQQQSPQDYRSGAYDAGYNNVNDSRGGYNYAQPNSSQNNAYDMRQFEQAPPISGYSTLPARSTGNARQNSDGFRPIQTGQEEQNKYPCRSTTGIQLSSSVSGNDGSYSQPMSPVQYGMNGNRNNESQYQRQPSVGQDRSDTNTGFQGSQFRKPVPYSPAAEYNYNQNGSTTLPLQRQTSSGQSSGKVMQSTISPGYNSGSMLPRSDDAPPPPPPPTNYQPEQYGRQPSYEQHTSPQRQYSRSNSGQQNASGNFGASPYEQRQNNYNSYQSRQGGGYDAPEQGIQRQGSRPYEAYDPSPPAQPQYQRQPSNPNYYDDGRGNTPMTTPSRMPQRQPQYDPSQQSQQYNNQYTPPQSYSRQTSRDQQNQPQYNRQPSQPVSRQTSRDHNIEPPTYTNPTSPAGNTINSFDDILSPFENFQNSNYCDKLFAPRSLDTRGGDIDSGVSMSSDTPRSNQSSNYSPPQPYSSGGFDDRGEVHENVNLLRPAPQAPPMPPVTPPPPPPPPPPPSDWAAQPKRKIPLESGHKDIGGQEAMPDKVLNTMLKNSGTQKPFAYVPTGADLKEFKERARQRRQPRSAVPRSLQGAEADAADQGRAPPAGPGQPETGVYKHAQYNSPLKMYSSDNAKQAFTVQSGGNVDVSGINNNTPERRPSDIKDSEVYKMCQAADAKGKNSHVVSEHSDARARDGASRDRSTVSRDGSESRDSQGMYTSGRAQGLSFRVLQWLTDTADDDEEASLESKTPKKPRDPLLRHNSVDDEMRFTGFHTKADIPSKAFQRLNKMAVSANSGNVTPQQEHSNQEENNDDDDGTVGNYDEASIRYRGNYIPSPSFRLLQSLAKQDEGKGGKGSPYLRVGGCADSSDDGLPDRLTEEDMIDKRGRGGRSMSSTSFKALKLHPDHSHKTGSDSESGGSKIKVINRARSPQVPPKPDRQARDSPVTEF